MVPGETTGDEVQVPQIPLLTMEIALKIMKKDTTPWEMYQLLIKFDVGKDYLVKKKLLLVKNCTKLVSMKKGYCRTI